MLVGPNILGTSMMMFLQIWIILMTFIWGGILMAAGSPKHKQSFAEIAKFPLFTLEDHPSMKGLYFTKVSLGNPPQHFNVIVDTGSDQFWVNCASQEMIGIPSYHMEQSRSASPVHCPQAGNNKTCSSFEMNYIDGASVSGFYARDVLHHDSFKANASANVPINALFGCVTHRYAVMKQRPEVEGILGLGPGSFLRDLSSESVAPQVVSHCLASQGNSYMILGEVLDSGLSYTPITSRFAYKVDLESVAVNDKLIPTHARGLHNIQDTLIDTGAQKSTLVAEVYDSLVKGVSAFVNKTPSYYDPYVSPCYYVSADVSEIYPKVRFNFRGGASLSLKPTDYLYLYKDTFGFDGWCISFKRGLDTSLPGVDHSVIGASLLLDKLIVYDLTHGQIGLVERDCSKSVNVSFIYDVGISQAKRYTWKTSTSFAIAMTMIYVVFAA